MKCEYLVNPLGVDTPKPRFTWCLNDSRPGARQTAYRILVDIDSIALSTGKGSIWNTGWVKSDEQLAIFSGDELKAFTKYFWRVDVTDQRKKKSTVGKIASFETGMMNQKNWQGSWISDTEDIQLKPAPYFRKTFATTKRIKAARAYMAAAGLYELSINGQRVGNHRLDPMYTRFDRRTLYVTYDVTPQLQAGENAIGVLLGNGWYNHQSTAVWNFDKANWRNRPAFCLDLRITYEDGTTETISSGKDWKTSLSPIIFNSIYTAEHYDARLEQPGWNTANFDDSKWRSVIYRSAPSVNVVAQVMHPIRDVEEMAAQGFRQLNDSTYLFDLGRNIAGVSSITVQGAAGTIVKLKHGERLYKNGYVDMSNIDEHYRPTDNTDPFQTDIFILSGRGEETFKPRFNYKGFQYVEVTSSKPITIGKSSLRGYFMHSDVPVAGQVRSSNPVLDKIWHATNNSYLSNLFGYPTDCPQREKNGWTGDAQIAIETGLYSFEGITVYEKWLADHRDEQQPNGVLPSIVPTSGWGYEWGNGPDWTSTIAIIPWNIYLFYGDKKLLVDCYDHIKRYVDHITGISPTGLTTWGLGDWVPVKSKTPVELTSTCYYYADAVILARAAQILGKETDYEKYMALSVKIKDAFNAKYLNRETGIYGDGVQTALSVPLYWGLVPENLKSKVAANLAKRVEADNYYLDVGLLGQKAILSALSENDYAAIAYKVAAQETYPSWGWWIRNGATTLYENWNIAASRDMSLNHIMFGEIGAWLYKGIGGIKPDPAQPGFKNILLKPHFVEELSQFEASHNGPYGKIVSSWKRTADGISYTVTVPANSTATLYLPVINGLQVQLNGKTIAATTMQLQAGEFLFEWKHR
ncbi:alpha-rhamnosidase [Pontibacter sp. SGAir0037]|nr:alpha-rhamnosidase [Pontibacter sp. SGAir0037]